MAEIALTEKTLADLVKLGRMSVNVQIAKEGGVPFAVIPNDCKVENLANLIYNEHNEHPERINGTAKALDAASFCHYYTLFNDANSRAFADETTSKILAVLDYHAAGDGNSPRWGRHRLELALRCSEEWNTWAGKDGAKMLQLDFSEFIENNAPDIVTPDAATMLEVAKDLSATTEASFGSFIRLQNGSVRFSYTEETNGTFGKDKLEVPEQFVIAIPVYIGSDRIRLTARLRYRINSGKLTFTYDLLRASAIKRDAFLATRTAIAEQLSITIINGTPA